MTSLTSSYEDILSEEEEAEESDEPSTPLLKPDPSGRKISALPEDLPDFVYDPSLDPKTRARLIEKEMNEQAQAVEDLRQLGASPSTVDTEMRKLQELQAAVFHDFRFVLELLHSNHTICDLSCRLCLSVLPILIT